MDPYGLKMVYGSDWEFNKNAFLDGWSEGGGRVDGVDGVVWGDIRGGPGGGVWGGLCFSSGSGISGMSITSSTRTTPLMPLGGLTGGLTVSVSIFSLFIFF